jgi:hypothetical protein
MKVAVITVSDPAIERRYGSRKHSRLEYTRATVAALEAVGLEPRVFRQIADISQANQRENALKALRWAAGSDEALLMCEDDIELGPDFLAFLHLARAEHRVTTFFLAHEMHYPPEVAVRFTQHVVHEDGRREGVAIEPGLYPVVHFHPEWSGTQCVFLPSAVVKEILVRESTLSPRKPFDIALRDYVHQTQPMLVAVPNPVQHRVPTTLVDTSRRGQLSPTFGWPTTRPVRELVREAYEEAV